MRTILIAAVVGALGVTALPATPASAQYWRGDHRDYRSDRHYRRDVARAQRECHRDLRRADSRRDYRRAQRACERELAQARRGHRYDRPRHYAPPRNGYYWDGRRWRSRW